MSFLFNFFGISSFCRFHVFCILRNKRLFSCCRSSILGFSKRIFRFRFRTLRLSLSHANATYCAAAAVMRPRSAPQLRALFFAFSLRLSLFAIEIPLQLQGKTHFDDTRFTRKTLACLQLSCSNNNNSSKDGKESNNNKSKHRLS